MSTAEITRPQVGVEGSGDAATGETPASLAAQGGSGLVVSERAIVSLLVALQGSWLAFLVYVGYRIFL